MSEMKVKLGKLFSVQESLLKFSKVELPIKMSYKYLKFFKKAVEELENFNKIRLRLFEKYGTLQKEGNYVLVGSDKIEEFKKEIEPLSEEEISLQWESVGIEELGNISLNAEDLNNLIEIKILRG